MLNVGPGSGTPGKGYSFENVYSVLLCLFCAQCYDTFSLKHPLPSLSSDDAFLTRARRPLGRPGCEGLGSPAVDVVVADVSGRVGGGGPAWLAHPVARGGAAGRRRRQPVRVAAAARLAACARRRLVAPAG